MQILQFFFSSWKICIYLKKKACRNISKQCLIQKQFLITLKAQVSHRPPAILTYVTITQRVPSFITSCISKTEISKYFARIAVGIIYLCQLKQRLSPHFLIFFSQRKHTHSLFVPCKTCITNFKDVNNGKWWDVSFDTHFKNTQQFCSHSCENVNACDLL